MWSNFSCLNRNCLQNGLTALHMAAQAGHDDVVELLLEKNFALDEVSSVSFADAYSFWTPLQFFLWQARQEFNTISSYLLQ